MASRALLQGMGSRQWEPVGVSEGNATPTLRLHRMTLLAMNRKTRGRMIRLAGLRIIV